ncbi:Casparian strip membrane protein domain [Dillenia turbinata]|uniref:CASP-like protein n=1 Tax=Dillenia turbinata TaxID=194707 RepID=A0AAN8WBW4_9MAGN
MKELIGRPGTWSGLMLRLGQCLFAAFSIGYLIASMGLQVLWSLGLACLDVYALCSKRDLLNLVLVSLFVVGDWVSKFPFEVPIVHIFGTRIDHHNVILWLVTSLVTATLSLAAACSSAGVMVLFAKDFDFCKDEARLACSRFQMSISLAFVTWFLIAISSHVMFWILASV